MNSKTQDYIKNLSQKEELPKDPSIGQRIGANLKEAGRLTMLKTSSVAGSLGGTVYETGRLAGKVLTGAPEALYGSLRRVNESLDSVIAEGQAHGIDNVVTTRERVSSVFSKSRDAVKSAGTRLTEKVKGQKELPAEGSAEA